MNQAQIALPIAVPLPEVARKQTLGHAMELCAELAGYSLDKELTLALKVDKAQFSRWMSGTEGIIWPKFTALMDYCGNDAPLFWMLHQRGYDLSSLRKRETEIEQALRVAQEEVNRLRMEKQVLVDALNGRKA